MRVIGRRPGNYGRAGIRNQVLQGSTAPLSKGRGRAEINFTLVLFALVPLDEQLVDYVGCYALDQSESQNPNVTQL
jgi:hypothetical protein